MNIMDFVAPVNTKFDPVGAMSVGLGAIGNADQRSIERQKLKQQADQFERSSQMDAQKLWLEGQQYADSQAQAAMNDYKTFIGHIQNGDIPSAAQMLPILQRWGLNVTNDRGGIGFDSPQGVGAGPSAPNTPTPQQPQANAQASGSQPDMSFQEFYKQAMESAPADLTPAAPTQKPPTGGKLIPSGIRSYMEQQLAPTPDSSATVPPEEVQQEMQRQDRAGVPLPGMPLPTPSGGNSKNYMGPAVPPEMKNLPLAPATPPEAKDIPLAPATPPEMKLAAQKPITAPQAAAVAHAMSVNGAVPQGQPQAPQYGKLHINFRGQDLGWVDPNLPAQRAQADASRIAAILTQMTPEKYRALTEALKGAKTPEEADRITRTFLEPMLSKLIGADAAARAAGARNAGANERHEMLDFKTGHDLVYEGLQKNPELAKHIGGYRAMSEAESLLKSGNRVASSMAYRKLAMELNSGAFSEADATSPDAFKPVADKLRTWASVGVYGDLDEKEKALLLDAVRRRKQFTLEAAKEAYDNQIASTDPASMYSNPAARRGWAHAMKNIYGAFPFYNSNEVNGIGGGGNPGPPKPKQPELPPGVQPGPAPKKRPAFLE